jgi:hypothetical protein
LPYVRDGQDDGVWVANGEWRRQLRTEMQGAGRSGLVPSHLFLSGLPFFICAHAMRFCLILLDPTDQQAAAGGAGTQK